MPGPDRPHSAKNVTLAAGHTLRYQEWPGDGPNLILLHGSAGYGLMFEWTAAYLGSRFHVFAPDQRGHGDSDRPDGTYSAQEYAEDLHQFVEALGLQRAVVGGHSLGGRVSQVFAATHPSECQGVILIGGLHLSNFFQDRARVERVLTSASAMLTSPTEFPTRDEALAYIRTVRTQDTEESNLHRLEHNMDRVGDGYRFKYDKVRVAQTLTYQSDNLRPYAPLVDAPVAIMRSTRGSELATLADAQAIAKLWKNPTVTDVEGDYLLHITGPEAFANAVATFIDTQVPAAVTA
ncbi:MAG: alpha/beta hydrolase [Chloroflexi bacterium]|nr:alpha/beta hydrolase [Chloroflexota bacterium]